MTYYIHTGQNGAIINGQFYEAICEGKVKDAIQFIRSQDWTFGKSYSQRLNLFKFAIDHDNTEIAKIIIAKDSMLDIKDCDSSNSLLHLAVLYRYLQFVEYLLVKKADIDVRNSQKRTPLHLACYGGSTNIVKLLLEFQADVNAVDVDGNTPLHLAAKHYRQRQRHEDLLQLLLLAGANVNACNKTGLMPIHLAVINKRDVTVRDLLKHGADIEAKTTDGKTPLNLAMEIQELNIAVDLITCHPNRKCNQSTNELLKGTTLLTRCKLFHIAIEKGSAEITNYLLDSNVDINSSDVSGRTALHLAVAENHEQIVELLLRRGVKVNVKDENGNTPLHLAVKNGRKSIVINILEYHPNIDEKNKYGKTALHLAISDKNLSVVELLLSKKASTVIQDQNGETPLHYAAKTCENMDMLAVLMHHGADVNVENNFKQTPLHIGALRGNVEIVKFLVGNGANCTAKDQHGNTALHLAAKAHLKEEMVLIFLENGIDPNTKNNFQETILHIACGGKCQKRFQLLSNSEGVENEKWWTLQYLSDLINRMSQTNCKLELQEKHESLPQRTDRQMDSIKEVEIDAIELLLENGAEIDAEDENGQTPIYHATMHCNAAVVKHLLDREADIQICDKTGKNAVCVAVERGNPEICDLIANNGAILYYPCNDAAFLYIALQNTDNYRRIVSTFALSGWVANLRAVNPYNLLLIVIKHRHIRIVEDCLMMILDVNDGNELGYTPLHAATLAQHDDIMQLVAYQDAFVRKGSDGIMPLHLAAYLGYIYGTQLILSFKALPNCRTPTGATPLHLAALKEFNTKVIALLIENKAYINLKDHKGMTPLHYAAAAGHVENVKTLLYYGADINLMNNKEDTPLSLVHRRLKAMMPPCTFAYFGDDIVTISKQAKNASLASVHSLLNTHASKLQLANLKLCETNSSCLESCGLSRRNCENEITKMKNENLSNNISWYDLLVECTCKLAQYVQSDDVQKCFSPEILKMNFPTFADLLRSRINIGMFLNHLTTDDDDLPGTVEPVTDWSEYTPSNWYDLSTIYENEKLPHYNVEEEMLIEDLDTLFES